MNEPVSLTANPFAQPKKKVEVSDEQKALRALLKQWNRTARSDHRFFLARIDSASGVVTDSYALRIMDGNDPVFGQVAENQVRTLEKKGHDAVFTDLGVAGLTADSMLKSLVRVPNCAQSASVEAAENDGTVFYRFTSVTGEQVVVNRATFLRAYREGDEVAVQPEPSKPLALFEPGGLFVGLVMPTKVSDLHLDWVTLKEEPA